MKPGVIRTFAVLGIIGGILQFLNVFFDEYVLGLDKMAHDVTIGVIDLVSAILIVIGLIALLAFHEKPGKNLLVSFLVLFFGMSLFIGFKYVESFALPMLYEHARPLAEDPPSPAQEGIMVTFMLFALSWLYFGISLLIKRQLPIAGAIIAMIGPIADFIPIDFGIQIAPEVWGIGIVWLSLAVFRGSKASDAPLDRSGAVST
ncbi:hypothetical protein [Paenibacillus silvisoli]|uniref:hypothetical protein n=1 Tax=Paenibacillus silvisoli TaxID=3110539 RepID=UPI0028051123|nr:hypothetical protein [Paenibacillus silvisoli]